MTQFVQNDGGRAAAGYSGTAGDCVCRAIAIAAQLPYQDVYDGLNVAAGAERPGSKRRRGKRSSAREGVFKPTIHRYMAQLEWAWMPTMFIGAGCQIHLKDEEMPMGRLVVNLSKHSVAMIDGVVHDLYDPSREGTRCVYGFFYGPEDRFGVDQWKREMLNKGVKLSI